MKELKAFCTFCMVFFVFYLLGSFYNASMDITTWTEGGRFVVTYIGGIAAIFGVLMTGTGKFS